MSALGVAGFIIVRAMFDSISFLGGSWLTAALMVVAGVAFLALFEADAASVPAID